MPRYKEIDLIITESEQQRMEEIAQKKWAGLQKILQEYINKNDMPYVAVFTVGSGASLGQLYDSVFSARTDLAKAYPHSFLGSLMTNTEVMEIVDSIDEKISNLVDEELVLIYSHTMMLIATCNQALEALTHILMSNRKNLDTATRELTERGILVNRAIFKPLKMLEKYRVVTEGNKEFIVSYDDKLLFTLEGEGLPQDKLVFIGNVQSSGDIHHVDDLPVFSTDSRLLFGSAGVPTRPIFISDTVLSVVGLDEVN